MKILLSTIISLAVAASVFSQTDGAGKVKSTSAKTPAKAKPKKPITPAPKRSTRARTPAKKSTPARPPVLATLTISVNEPGAAIFLTDSEGKSVFEPESQQSSIAGEPIMVEDIKAGTYKLLVRKSGYADENRDLIVKDGKSETVAVEMRALVAFLTVTNAEGATIEVEGVGAFLGGSTRQQLKPGTYKLRITKKGFRPDTQTVEARLGVESIVVAALQPVPISEMLAEAEAALRSQNADRALELCKEILATEPDNVKASLFMGRALFQNAQPGAAAFLISALRNGESVALPIRIYNRARAIQIPEGELVLDGSELQVRSSLRADLSFRLGKPELRELSKRFDEQNMTYVSFKGKGESGGKKAERTLRIYSANAALKSGKTMCSPTTKMPNRCDPDIDNLHDLISRWQIQLR